MIRWDAAHHVAVIRLSEKMIASRHPTSANIIHSLLGIRCGEDVFDQQISCRHFLVALGRTVKGDQRRQGYAQTLRLTTALR